MKQLLAFVFGSVIAGIILCCIFIVNDYGEMIMDFLFSTRAGASLFICFLFGTLSALFVGMIEE